MNRPPNLTRQLRRAPTQYLPILRLASGGMAEVWMADAVFEDGESHPVAIKRVHPHLTKDPLYRSMFEDEARLGMALRHPNIVRVYDGREIGDTLIMVMDMVDGASLKAVLDRARDHGSRLPVPVALFIAREVAQGLAYAHGATDAQGAPLEVIHRDVSPHNILLSKQGEVKLADFGLADAKVHETARAADSVAGKLGYLAPEEVLSGTSDHRVDLFAVGVVLWEMLAGERLFQVADPKATVRNVVTKVVPRLSMESPSPSRKVRVSGEIDDLLARLLVREREKRVPSGEALVKDLDRLLGGPEGVAEARRSLALAVGLHCAEGSGDSRPDSLLPERREPLADLLAAFVDAVEQDQTDAGARALNPSDFRLPAT
ncbi:MAG: serine/threonine protein kinase [Myxococcales bacterium]|nr:serine/threonine protein kinase [Myxococcales bacterium]